MSYQTKALLEAPFQVNSGCAKGAIREHGSTLEIFLQRRSVSSSLEISCKYFFAEIQGWQNSGRFTLSYHAHDIGKQVINHNARTSLDECIKYLAKYASQRLDCDVRINTQVMEYCHSVGTMYDYQKSDLMLSPVYYCALTNSIKRCDNAHTIAEFQGDDLSNTTISINNYDCLFKAVNSFMCEWDKKQGAEHLKRRITWLAGQSMISENPNMRCEFVTQQMERIDMFAMGKALAANSLGEPVTLLRGHWKI